MASQKSTIVRAMRLAFGTMEAIAPGPGAVLAERLWCRIPRGRDVTSGTPGDLFTVKVNGRDVVAEAWGDGPIVYLVHGWGGRRAQLDAFVDPLLWAGHRVISFDVPGHGESAPGAFGPGFGLLPDFTEALNAVVAVGGPAHALIGHSFGGTTSALAVLDGLAVQRMALIAPMADPTPYTVEFAQTLGFGERIRTGFIRRLERRVGRRWGEYSVLDRTRAAHTSLPPMLVVHDRGDKEVHHRDGEAIAAVWPGTELVTTTGLGHYRILQDSHVVERVVGHLAAVRQ